MRFCDMTEWRLPLEFCNRGEACSSTQLAAQNPTARLGDLPELRDTTIIANGRAGVLVNEAGHRACGGLARLADQDRAT